MVNWSKFIQRDGRALPARCAVGAAMAVAATVLLAPPGSAAVVCSRGFIPTTHGCAPGTVGLKAFAPQPSGSPKPGHALCAVDRRVVRLSTEGSVRVSAQTIAATNRLGHPAPIPPGSGGSKGPTNNNPCVLAANNHPVMNVANGNVASVGGPNGTLITFHFKLYNSGCADAHDVSVQMDSVIYSAAPMTNAWLGEKLEPKSFPLVPAGKQVDFTYPCPSAGFGNFGPGNLSEPPYCKIETAKLLPGAYSINPAHATAQQP